MALKLSEWRGKLLYWLQTQIAIDGWDLNTPDPGYSTGFIPPLRGLSYVLNSPTEIRAVATQDIFILKSYDGFIKYHDLPISTLEGVYQTIGIRLVHDYRSICDELEDLTFEGIQDPITVKSQGNEVDDWLIELHWVVNLEFLASPEIGVVQPPFELKAIVGGIYRSKLQDIQDNKLDLTFRVGEEPSIPDYLSGAGGLALGGSGVILDVTPGAPGSLNGDDDLALDGTGNILDNTLGLSGSSGMILGGSGSISDATLTLSGSGTLALSGSNVIYPVTTIIGTGGLALGSTGIITERLDSPDPLNGNGGLALNSSALILQVPQISGSNNLALSGSGTIKWDGLVYRTELDDPVGTSMLALAPEYNPGSLVWSASAATANGSGQFSTNGDSTVALLSVGLRDVKMTLRLRYAASTNIGFNFRALDNDNRWGTNLNVNGTYQIIRRLSASNTTIATGSISGFTLLNTYVILDLVVIGNTLSVYIDGTLAYSLTDSRLSTDISTGNRVGFNSSTSGILLSYLYYYNATP